MLGGPDCDSWSERGDGLVADVLVDHVGGAPEQVEVDAGVELETGQRLGQPLSGGAMKRQRDGIDGTRNAVGAGPHGLERGRERVPSRSLAVEADREPRLLADRMHELRRAVRQERSRRIVQEDARGTEIRQLACLLDQDVGLARVARAVDEAGVELSSRRRDRLCRLTQIRHVVERIVETEDLDAVLGGGGDEAADEVGPDRPGADEEAATESEAERSLRPRLQRADPLPRAFDAAPDGAVEHAATRYLEAGEARAVQDLGDLEDRAGRKPPRQGLLAEQADRRVDQYRHARSLEWVHPQRRRAS